jgi:hypothetical protein
MPIDNPTKTTLTWQEIADLARSAGFPDKEIPTAVGVAIAESGGNPSAHNAVPPDDSYGLWQINMLGKLGPSRRKQFGIQSNGQLYNPQTNAKAAHMIWRQSGWKAWSTYNNGAYQKPMRDAVKVITGAVPGAMDAAIDEPDPITSLIGQLAKSQSMFGEIIESSAIRAAALIGGIAIVIVGFVLLFLKPTTKVVSKIL